MRLKLTVFLLFCSGFLSAGQHVSEVSGPVKDAGTLEIVTEQPVPAVKFAAKELQTYLKQATGQDIPIVRKASGGKTALILGDGPSARAARLMFRNCRKKDSGFSVRAAAYLLRGGTIRNRIRQSSAGGSHTAGRH